MLLLFCLIVPAIGFSDRVCSYESYQWNTITKRAVNRQFIRKLYTDLTDEEIDAKTGCSVCREDQVWLKVESVPPTLVCHRFHDRFQNTVQTAIDSGFPITEFEGYRVGRTRGDVDFLGRRTGFSNHSFGVALDINSSSNGLYNNCMEFNNRCHLIRGGPWEPQTNPGSIKPDSHLIKMMASAGLRWGGEIKGRQKDFMHFSVSGY